MKKLLLMLLSITFVFGLTACDDLCVGPECITNAVDDSTDDNDDDTVIPGGTSVDNVIPYIHLNGHGEETEKNGFILFEVEVRDYVKYQVAYLSCTCRDAVVNYYNVAYIEINKYTNDVRTLSFDKDGENGHYHPGTWGDSSGDENQNNVTFEMFEDDFFPWIVGKTSADLEGIYYFNNGDYFDLSNTKTIDETDLIDEFAGSSVSTNNIIRIVKELLSYHEENYGS